MPNPFAVSPPFWGQLRNQNDIMDPSQFFLPFSNQVQLANFLHISKLCFEQEGCNLLTLCLVLDLLEQSCMLSSAYCQGLFDIAK